MSYHAKRTVTSIVTGAAVLAAYCIYVFGPAHAGAQGDLQSWAVTMLIFLGISAAAAVAIQVVFHIMLSVGIAVKETVKETVLEGKIAADNDQRISRSINAEFVEDERDRLIDLKSMRVGFFAAGVGFIAGLVSLALGYSAIVMLNVLYLSFGVASLLSEFANLVYYRRGV